MAGFKPSPKHLHPASPCPASAAWGSQTCGEIIPLLLLPWGTEKYMVISFGIPCEDRKSIFEQLFMIQSSFGLFAWETCGCFEWSLNGIYLFLWSLKGYRLHQAAEELSCHVVWIKTQLLNLHDFNNLSETLLALMEQVDMASDAKDLLVLAIVAPLWDAFWATEICHRLICLGRQGSQSWSLDVWIFCADKSLLSFDECIKSWRMSGVFD